MCIRDRSNIKTVALTETDANTLRAQLQRRESADTDKVAMGHALGKLEEDRGQHSAALAAFSAANTLQHRLTPWSAQAFVRFVDQALAASQHLPCLLYTSRCV